MGLSYNYRKELRKLGATFGVRRFTSAKAMTLKCSQCQKRFLAEEQLSVSKSDRSYLFCNIKCRDKWLYADALEKWLEDASEAFNPRAFTYIQLNDR